MDWDTVAALLSSIRGQSHSQHGKTDHAMSSGEIEGAVRLALSALGKQLRKVREQSELSQDELARDLTQFGFRSSPRRIREIEHGRGAPPSALMLDVWLARCHLRLRNERALALREYQKLVQWLYDLRHLVPTAISWNEFNDLAIVVADLSDRAPADLRASRYLVERIVTDLALDRAARLDKDEPERDIETKSGQAAEFTDLYGIWKGKSNFSYEEIKQAEIQLKGFAF